MVLNELPGDLAEFAKNNPITTSIIGGSLLAGAAVGTAAVVKSGSGRKRRKRKSSSSHSKRRKRSKAHRSRRRRTPHTAGKRRDRSTKRIRYTKNGQPYVILRSGKARFIKSSSAKRSRKLKGGRY